MKTIFTVGEVARICKVAPRTVNKWFDSGRLRGYRIPGSQDRRIPREHLIRFLKEHGMPLGELDDDSSRVSIDEPIEDMCAALWELRARVIEPVLDGTCSALEKSAIEDKARRIQFVRDELSLFKSWG